MLKTYLNKISLPVTSEKIIGLSRKLTETLGEDFSLDLIRKSMARN